MTSLKPVTSILCGLLLLPAVADAADLVLAADGKSDYQIVVPDTFPTPQICELIGESAQLIQRAFAANGFDVPVVSESKRDSAKPGTYLVECITGSAGPTKTSMAARGGISTAIPCA
jgi:hypothetical protein